MNSNPLVSVAVITYNQKDFLKECIESILLQDYPNIEIVIADDASSDGTQDVLQEYKARNPDKFVLRLSGENRGITENSNAAHFACTGKYIAWMGGDDIMLPGKIKAQVELMEANPNCAVCFHDAEVFDNATNEILHLRSDIYELKDYSVSEIIKRGTVNLASATMVRRSRTPKLGFNSTIPVASDWLYWIETMIDGGEMKCLGSVLVRYRRHKDNVTRYQKYAPIGQNIIDHLTSANIIAARYPQYFPEAMHRFSGVLLSLRHNSNYFKVVSLSLRMSFRFRSLGALLIYMLTLSFVKL